MILTFHMLHFHLLLASFFAAFLKKGAITLVRSLKYPGCYVRIDGAHRFEAWSELPTRFTQGLIWATVLPDETTDNELRIIALAMNVMNEIDSQMSVCYIMDELNWITKHACNSKNIGNVLGGQGSTVFGKHGTTSHYRQVYKTLEAGDCLEIFRKMSREYLDSQHNFRKYIMVEPNFKRVPPKYLHKVFEECIAYLKDMRESAEAEGSDPD